MKKAKATQDDNHRRHHDLPCVLELPIRNASAVDKGIIVAAWNIATDFTAFQRLGPRVLAISG